MITKQGGNVLKWYLTQTKQSLRREDVQNLTSFQKHSPKMCHFSCHLMEQWSTVCVCVCVCVRCYCKMLPCYFCCICICQQVEIPNTASWVGQSPIIGGWFVGRTTRQMLGGRTLQERNDRSPIERSGKGEKWKRGRNRKWPKKLHDAKEMEEEDKWKWTLNDK